MFRCRGLAPIVLVIVVIASGFVAMADSPSRTQVEVLAAGLGGPADVVVDETHVFWTNREAGELMRLDKTGGNPTVLIDGEKRIGRLAIDDAHVYWTSGAKIMKCTKAGEQVTLLATGETQGNRGPSGIAVDHTNVYWTQYFPKFGSVWQIDKRGGTPKKLAAGQDGAFYLAVDLTQLYWTNHSGRGKAVMKIRPSGGEPTAVATGQSNPTYIAVDRQSVYWTNLIPNGAVMVQRKAADKPEILAGLQAGPSALALDDTHVYWTSLSIGRDNWANKSRVLSITKHGGVPQVVVESPEHFWGLTVDDRFVYWTSHRAGTLSRIRKR